MCVNFGEGDLTKYSLLCPNGEERTSNIFIIIFHKNIFIIKFKIFAGTLFNQQYFICDWWFNVDCSQAEDFYSLNEDVAAAAAAASAEAGGAGEPSNELATYTLPEAAAAPVAPLRRNPKKNNRFGFGF